MTTTEFGLPIRALFDGWIPIDTFRRDDVNDGVLTAGAGVRLLGPGGNQGRQRTTSAVHLR